MDARQLVVRNLTYELFVRLGRAPTLEELALQLGMPVADVLETWRALHAEHALVLAPSGHELLMANPFSAVPTPYRVRAAGRQWYGNCAWDALGICAALRTDGEIETSCPDCGEPVSLLVCDQRVDDESLLFHCLVAAAHWWDDIAFA